MQISDPIQRAHERLMQQLPVRTHVRKLPPPPRNPNGRPTKQVTEHNGARIAAMWRAGKTVRQIADALDISEVGVRKRLHTLGLWNLRKQQRNRGYCMTVSRKR